MSLWPKRGGYSLVKRRKEGSFVIWDCPHLQGGFDNYAFEVMTTLNDRDRSNRFTGGKVVAA